MDKQYFISTVYTTCNAASELYCRQYQLYHSFSSVNGFGTECSDDLSCLFIYCVRETNAEQVFEIETVTCSGHMVGPSTYRM